MELEKTDVIASMFPATNGITIYFYVEGSEQMKSRTRQRANRKMKQKEELLDKKNGLGIKDLTAYNAVKQIATNGKATIALS